MFKIVNDLITMRNGYKQFDARMRLGLRISKELGGCFFEKIFFFRANKSAYYVYCLIQIDVRL